MSLEALKPLVTLGKVFRKFPSFSNRSTSNQYTSASAKLNHYPSPLRYSVTPIKKIWIMPNWLCVSTPEHFLSEAESLFVQRKYQSGLAYVDHCLQKSHHHSGSTSRPHPPIYDDSKIDIQTITEAERVNLYLIRSCGLLACPKPSRGLIATDTAL